MSRPEYSYHRPTARHLDKNATRQYIFLHINEKYNIRNITDVLNMLDRSKGISLDCTEHEQIIYDTRRSTIITASYAPKTNSIRKNIQILQLLNPTYNVTIELL